MPTIHTVRVVPVPLAFHIDNFWMPSWAVAVGRCIPVGDMPRSEWLMFHSKLPAVWYTPTLPSRDGEPLTGRMPRKGTKTRRYQWLLYADEMVIYDARTGGVVYRERRPTWTKPGRAPPARFGRSREQVNEGATPARLGPNVFSMNDEKKPEPIDPYAPTEPVPPPA